MVDPIVDLEAIIGLINGVLFLLPLISRRVRRFMIKVAISDIIMSLNDYDDELYKWVEALCLYFEVRRGNVGKVKGKTRVEVREEDD